MARKALGEKNLRRKRLIQQQKDKRDQLRDSIHDKNISQQERFILIMKLASMSRDSAPVRYRNRCELTNRPRAYYRRFGLSRNKLRELASTGKLPGVIKASWG